MSLGAISGVSLIADERMRQADAEGFNAAHDDKYGPGTLAMAAIIYATCAASSPNTRAQLREYSRQGISPNHWPWPPEFWKPGPDDSTQSRIRELTKAGALIAAEIDYLRRRAEVLQ